MKKRVLVTGVAGFIGFHLVNALLDNEDYEITGIDNLNDYYDTRLKVSRLNVLFNKNKNESSEFNYSSYKTDNFKFYKIDLNDKKNLDELFEREKFNLVINLAAQAGVRYSITNPSEYVDSNITGFFNLIDCVRKHEIVNFIYASSSSVYGIKDQEFGFSENQITDAPISLYAASKKTNELIAHTYSSLYSIKTIGLRFFTVYGPWGRPDMAYYSFTKRILNGESIKLFNYGNQKRDFTYIDDVVNCISLLIDQIENLNDNYNIFNIGNNNPESLMYFVHTIEKSLNKKANIEFETSQLGDVSVTYADCSKLFGIIQFQPNTRLESGISKFVNWFLSYDEHNKIN